MTHRQAVSAWSLVFCVNMHPAVAASNAPAAQQITQASIWWPSLVSALIGAIAALVTPLVKDLFIPRWNEQRAQTNNQREIFRNYAAPLAASSEKFIWRSNEILIENRHHFLKMATLPLVYNEYKRRSTLYRIASILGWIRAIHLELSALPRGASGFLTPISDAIGKVQCALADGPHVELHRLEQLSAVWRLDVSSLAEERKRSLATKVEVKLYELAGDKLKHDSEQLKKMSDEDKSQLCQSLAGFLCQELGRTMLDSRIVNETLNQAIDAVLYREALIYRDWQDAIGDAMLENDQDSVRRFKIIGYEKFEEILKGNSLWIEVFRESINDIDFDSINPNDFRVKQLKDLAAGVSQILISLSQTNEKDLINSSTLQVARKIVDLS